MHPLGRVFGYEGQIGGGKCPFTVTHIAGGMVRIPYPRSIIVNPKCITCSRGESVVGALPRKEKAHAGEYCWVSRERWSHLHLARASSSFTVTAARRVSLLRHLYCPVSSNAGTCQCTSMARVR